MKNLLAHPAIDGGNDRRKRGFRGESHHERGRQRQSAIELLRVSAHARYPSNGPDYVQRTARNAAHYVE
jgi:hypothetical protein